MRLPQLEVKMTVISILMRYRIYKGSELKVSGDIYVNNGILGKYRFGKEGN
ncbi:hypothetical protein DPMN_158941 [Dreissena polymorpha]|uniref:Uncharacterized protein n=1 Tax=Dreissena polymorpha TaxID=45954 RepID=A0A9D4IMF7_DREPO|nr:hypothetical protein DPMN_158941 [Dreissena polymorpha]